MFSPSASIFVGASAPAVVTINMDGTVALASVTEHNFDPTDSFAGWQFLATGAKKKVSDSSLTWTSQGTWATIDKPPYVFSSGADYEIRATLTAGSAPSAGTTGSWEALSATRTWYNTYTAAAGERTSTLTFEIRLVASPFTVFDTVTDIVINAQTSLPG